MRTKKSVTISALFLLSIILAAMSQLSSIKTAEATDRATLMWGTKALYSDYEFNASRDTSAYIKSCFYSTGVYNLCQDYWGDNTRATPFYANVSNCAKNYDYATVFYKGHTALQPNCGGHTHVTLYDVSSGSAGNAIWDNVIHDNAYRQSGVQPKIHRFVFLWSCANDEMGWFDSTHCYGMPAAWFNRTDLSEDAWPYYGSDNSDVTYIGFENVSKDFVEETGYGSPPGYNYGDFCRTFYDYALDPGAYTIRLALYYASYDTIGCDYTLSPLYEGYTVWVNGTPYYCRQVFYGDGHEELPD